MKTLQNKEIKLRALEPEDLEILYNWENNPDTWRVSNTLVPISKYLLKKYLQDSGKDIFETKQLRLIIQLQKDELPVGAIDLFDFDPFHKRAGIGILIADKDSRNKGYASQSLGLLIEYCFDVLHLHQIYCNIGKNNEPSIKLFTNAGFVVSGIKRDWLNLGNLYEDEYLLQLINPNPGIPGSPSGN